MAHDSGRGQRSRPVLLLAFVAVALFPGTVRGQGDPQGPEFRINSYTPGLQAAPAIASSPSGDLVVVWASDAQDGSLHGVFGQRYGSSGVPIGAEFRVNTFTAVYQTVADVASDAAGNFVVVWEGSEQSGSSFDVFAQRYASSGTPLGAEFRVNAVTTGIQSGPAVAMDPAGNFLVVWNRNRIGHLGELG